MARNKEKQFGLLNRLYLEKEKDDILKLRPKRPPLSSLETADEVKQWLPSIKRDIDFNLKQTEVTCYREAKIEEYKNEVERLEREYKRFVRKIKQLDCDVKETPWNERPYRSKKMKLEETQTESIETPSIIRTPILDSCPIISPEEENVEIVGNDQPLQFKPFPIQPKPSPHRNQVKPQFSNDAAVQATETKLKKIFGLI